MNDVVVGLLVVLVIGLAIAGIVLAVIGPGFERPVTERDKPDRPEPAGAPPARKWLDASKSAAKRGDVRVTISSTTIGAPRLIQASGRAARPKREFLLIALQLENVSAERKLDYASWGGDSLISRRVKLNDNFGKTYRRKSFRGFEIDGQLSCAPIGPNGQVHDLLVFEPPAERADCLLLELPAAAFGQPGALYFRIPKEMIVAADGELELEDPARDGVDLARPLETGVPEINRGIAELEAEEKGDVPEIFEDYPGLRGDENPDDEGFSFEGKFDDFQPSPKHDKKQNQEKKNK